MSSELYSVLIKVLGSATVKLIKTPLIDKLLIEILKTNKKRPPNKETNPHKINREIFILNDSEEVSIRVMESFVVEASDK